MSSFSYFNSLKMRLCTDGFPVTGCFVIRFHYIVEIEITSIIIVRHFYFEKGLLTVHEVKVSKFAI